MYIQGPTLLKPTELVLGEVTGKPEFALMHASPYEEYVLKELLKQVRGQHKYVEVKIRCKDLPANTWGMFNNKPHTDTTENMNHPALEEVHHLFVTPPNTIFYGMEPILLPEYTIVSYGRDLHQTPLVRLPTRRLIIRVSETDIVKPRREVRLR